MCWLVSCLDSCVSSDDSVSENMPRDDSIIDVRVVTESRSAYYRSSNVIDRDAENLDNAELEFLIGALQKND